MRHSAFAAAIAAATTIAGAAYAQDTTSEPGVNHNREIEQQIESRTGSTDGATVSTDGAGPGSGAEATPGSGAAVEWVGLPLAAIDGTRVGRVTEVRTTSSGAVTEVRAEVGGILGLFARHVAIPVERIMVEQDGTLVAEMSADEIRQAPEVSG